MTPQEENAAMNEATRRFWLPPDGAIWSIWSAVILIAAGLVFGALWRPLGVLTPIGGVVFAHWFWREYLAVRVDDAIAWLTPWALALLARAQGYRDQYQKRAHEDRLREMSAEADTAVRAALLDTVDGDIQVAGQRAAFNTEIERLLLIPKRSRAQELSLFDLQRKVRGIDIAMGNFAALGDERIMPLAGAGGRSLSKPPLFRWQTMTIGGPMHWYAIGGLVALLMGASGLAFGEHQRAERLEDRAELAENEAREATNAAQHNYTVAENARRQAQASAEAIEAERARVAAERARDRRRNDVSRQIESGSAPDWRGILGLMQPPGDAPPAPADGGSANPGGMPGASGSGGGADAAPDNGGAAASR